MDKGIKEKISKLLMEEAKSLLNEEGRERVHKLNDIFNTQKILDNYDELEPTIQEYFRKKAEKDKWSR